MYALPAPMAPHGSVTAGRPPRLEGRHRPAPACLPVCLRMRRLASQTCVQQLRSPAEPPRASRQSCRQLRAAPALPSAPSPASPWSASQHPEAANSGASRWYRGCSRTCRSQEGLGWKGPYRPPSSNPPPWAGTPPTSPGRSELHPTWP